MRSVDMDPHETRGTQIAAYFDVDGTLTDTSSVTPLAWFRRRRGRLSDRIWAASLLLRGPWWMALYRLNNDAGNREIYCSYAGMNAAWVRGEANACFELCIKPRLMLPMVQRLEALKQSGVRIVLVTGGLDFIMQPVAAFLGAELIAPGLIEKNGLFTGAMSSPPLTGSAKYVAVCKHATHHNIDLHGSHAFGNEFADANMLHAVGHPVAVRPDGRLRKIAEKKSWTILDEKAE